MFARFLPTRKKEEVNIVMDLDRLISDSVGFMLHGKVRHIKPLNLQNFFEVTNEIAKLDLMRQAKETDRDTLRKAYFSLFKKACEPITEDDLKKMGDAQIAALVQQILNCVTGHAQASGEKKTLARA